ncbi:MAG: hypothetical protein K9M10_03155 [Candidatus Pacebacteria bacterium]|nr:hypothetical protein [Candidatus Paceibacterota bacterium]MCF7857452.1 hypothetical protein [Candidatus Paceibacterota bacterium]
MEKRKPYLTNLSLIHQGKVRDTFAIPGRPDLRLMVATDAVSTHNVAHKSPIPQKGQILTAMPVFWATRVFPDMPTHIVAFGKEIYDFLPNDLKYPEDLHLRALVVLKLYMAPFELIFRMRMAGSLWSNYQKGLPNPYGIDLRKGFELMSPLGTIFTPTEKTATDDPVNSNVVRALCPSVVLLARKAYLRGYEFALTRGIEIIDSKAEIGADDSGQLRLADEWLTGDCCRFVEADKIVVGEDPPWADKEIVRQAAVRLWGGKKSGPPLEFPEDVIQECGNAYHRVFEQITGYPLTKFQEEFF